MKTSQGLPVTVLIWWVGGSIDGQLGKDHKDCKDYPLTVLILWGVNQWSTWRGSAKTWQGLPVAVLIWGSIDGQLGKDP